MTYALYAQAKGMRYYYGDDGQWYRSGTEPWFPPLAVKGAKQADTLIRGLEVMTGLPIVAVPQTDHPDTALERSTNKWQAWSYFKRALTDA